MTVRLTILRGPKAGQAFEFDDDEITIGSGRTNNIVLMDNDVSTVQCRLLRVQTDYDIEDLGSRYGTFVNGQRLKEDPITLPRQAIIELGGHINIEYELIGEKPKKNETAPLLLEPDNPNSQPVLVYVENGKIRGAYLLQEERLSVGRSVGNDIIIQEIDISRRHIAMLWRKGQFWVKDNGSRNGTFLNGERLRQPQPLKYKDVLRLGASVQLQLVQRSDLPAAVEVISTGEIGTGNDEQTTIPFALNKRDWREGTRELPSRMQEGELNGHIFLTYAEEGDGTLIRSIISNLGDSKQEIWTDQNMERGTESWRMAVEQAHRECWLLVIISSPAALESNYVRDHYRYFYNREKPIILVEYKPVDKLPIQLAKVPRIEYDADNPGRMYQRLLYEIMHLKPRHYNG